MPSRDVPEIERYGIGGDHEGTWMAKHPDGLYVTYEDHQQVAAAKDKEGKEAQAELAKLRADVRYHEHQERKAEEQLDRAGVEKYDSEDRADSTDDSAGQPWANWWRIRFLRRRAEKAEKLVAAKDERIADLERELEEAANARFEEGCEECGARAQKAEATLASLIERLTGEEAQAAVVEFLDSWRFCPVSQASGAARSCLDDAAKQLLAALDQALSTQPDHHQELQQHLEEVGAENLRHERNFWRWKCGRRDEALAEWNRFKEELAPALAGFFARRAGWESLAAYQAAVKKDPLNEDEDDFTGEAEEALRFVDTHFAESMRRQAMSEDILRCEELEQAADSLTQPNPVGAEAELAAINEVGFEEVLKLRDELEAMTRARDLCKQQTAKANERLEKTREAWRHEKERADGAQDELDRERRRKNLGPQGAPNPVGAEAEAAEIRAAIESGSSPEAKAIHVLRKFMCCRAGEQWVEHGLLRPFRYTMVPVGAEAKAAPIALAVAHFRIEATRERTKGREVGGGPLGGLHRARAQVWEKAAEYAERASPVGAEARGEDDEFEIRWRNASRRAEQALDQLEGARAVLERIATGRSVTDIQGEYEKEGPLSAEECRRLAADALRHRPVQPAPQDHKCICADDAQGDPLGFDSRDPVTAKPCPVHSPEYFTQDHTTAASEPSSESPGNSGEWREQFVALRDRLFGAEALDAAGRVKIETTYPHRSVDLDKRREIIAAAWNVATGHDHSLLLTQPVPGNSGGVEEAARKIESEAADARKAAEGLLDPQAKAAHNGRAQALDWSAQNLRKLAAPTQPPSPQSDPAVSEEEQ